MSFRIPVRVLLGAWLAVAPWWAHANSYPELETNRLNRPSDTIAASGNDLFGEQVDLYNGQTSFSATDLSIPGTGRIPVALTRSLNVVEEDQNGTLPGFENWELDVPYLSGNFAEFGWVVGPNASSQRCSVSDVNAATPTTLQKGATSFAAREYWSGYIMHVPGAGSQEMLLANATSPHPVDGRAYPWVTKSLWALRCLPSLQSGGSGEGFVAVSPDGTSYYFDRMFAVSHDGSVVTKTWTFHDEILNITKTIQERYPRYRVYLVASHAVDRFGNTVAWNYDDQGRLQSISASDGRAINLTWNGNHVVSARDGAHTWGYRYLPYTAAPSETPTTRLLAGVDLPDASSWSFQYDGNLALVDTSPPPPVRDGEPNPTYPPTCNGVPIPLGRQAGAGYFTLTATHPSGARGVFAFKPLIRGLSYDPYKCSGANPAYPKESEQFALFSKTLDGPGVSAATWTYSYSGSLADNYNSSWADDCPNDSCPASVWTQVHQPDGSNVRRTFGNRWGLTEGQLQSVQVFRDGDEATSLDQQSISYWTYASDQPFPQFVGTSVNPKARTFMSSEWHPQLAQVHTRDGVSFHSAVAAFDAYGNPSRTSAWSQEGAATLYSRTEVATLYQDLSHWVLNQPAALTNVDTGVEVYRRNYDPVTALPTDVTSFGLLAASYQFGSDGNVRSVTDGNGHVTTFSDYYRGVPRAVRYADGTTRTAAVDDQGRITAITDPIGADPSDTTTTATTSFAYDPMGRLRTITPPAGDVVAWAPTNISFVRVNASEYGLPAGHWRQTVKTGNATRTTYFDALWRPLLSRSWDAGKLAATQRFTAQAFDFAGRTVFASVPVATLGRYDDALVGIHTTYDSLGRPTTSVQDSELGPLTTRYDYLPGFITQVTNPRGFVTGTANQVFDGPDTSRPTAIVAPEGVTTTITRDVFGKAQAITRSGLQDGLPISQARRYVYDTHQRLCKRIEPETGASFFAYDGAGNITWSSAGSGQTALTTPSQCEAERDGVPANTRTSRRYDARDRLLAVGPPDGLDNLSYSWFNDGALHTLGSGSGAAFTQWTYTWSKTRLPLTETLAIDGRSSTITHTYDAYGHEKQLTYPDGLKINYTPDALGQPTQAGAYATGVSYFANGAMRGFTYGNGIVHSLTRNQRGLPLRSVVQAPDQAAVLDSTYTYDGNGNVAAIDDGTSGHADSRTMTYDGLDRLTRTDAPNQWWISAGTRYDVLDNIRSNQVGNTAAYLNTYTYDPDTGRLAGVAGHVNWTLSYDSHGNVTGKGPGNDSYVFDAADRLQAVAGKESYRYDGHGRRVKVTRLSDGKSAYPIYTLTGQLLSEDDARANTRTDYVSLKGSLVGKRVATLGRQNWKLTYEHTDALHSPTVETDASGGMTRAEHYTPYGEPGDGRYVQGPGFTGHVTDAATGLTYAQQRYYDPQIGRFLSVDPVTAYGDPVGSFNRYKYAANNPYGFKDPDGRQECRSCDAFGDQFARDAAAGNLAVYAPFEKPTLIVAGAMLAATPVVGPYLATAFKQMMSRISVRQRPDGVPKNWVRRPSKDGKGYEWRNPKNEHDSVRTSTGNPNSSQAGQREPYVARQSDGMRYDNAGQQVPKKSEESHIPLKDYTHKSAEELRRLNQ